MRGAREREGKRERDACSCEQFDVFPKCGSLAHAGTMAMDEGRRRKRPRKRQWGGRQRQDTLHFRSDEDKQNVTKMAF